MSSTLQLQSKTNPCLFALLKHKLSMSDKCQCCLSRDHVNVNVSESSMQGAVNELIVVTIMVAAYGRLNIPRQISSLADLRSALVALGGLGAHQILGVELLWTPQAEGDYYTRDEIISDYPNLVPL